MRRQIESRIQDRKRGNRGIRNVSDGKLFNASFLRMF